MKNTKRNNSILKKIISCVLFIVVLFFVLFFVNKILERKESRVKYASFFEHADDIDVLLLGSSHVINGINPLILYEEAGITSYNMGGHGSPIKATYYELLNALDYMTPKLVVVDAYMLEKNYEFIDVMNDDTDEAEIQSSIQQLHLNMDVFPISKTKYNSVNALVSSLKIKLQFLFPFIIYHDRWKELDVNDFKAVINEDEINSYMGAEPVYTVFGDSENYDKTDEGLSDSTTGTDYLWRILEECKNRDIDVVLTHLPFYATYEDQKASHTAKLIADEFGIKYINFNELSDFDEFNYETDLADHGHLNITGCEKVSKYLSKELSEYNLEDHRGDEKYSYWDDMLNSYRSENADKIIKGDELYVSLNLYANSRVDDLKYKNFICYIRDGSMMLNDAVLKKTLKNISSDENIDIAFESGESYLCIYDYESGNFKSIVGARMSSGGEIKEETVDGSSEGETSQNDSIIQTSVGEMGLIISGDYRNLYIDGNYESNIFDMESHFNDDMQLIYYNSDGDFKKIYYNYDGITYKWEY